MARNPPLQLAATHAALVAAAPLLLRRGAALAAAVEGQRAAERAPPGVSRLPQVDVGDGDLLAARDGPHGLHLLVLLARVPREAGVRQAGVVEHGDRCAHAACRVVRHRVEAVDPALRQHWHVAREAAAKVEVLLPLGRGKLAHGVPDVEGLEGYEDYSLRYQQSGDPEGPVQQTPVACSVVPAHHCQPCHDSPGRQTIPGTTHQRSLAQNALTGPEVSRGKEAAALAGGLPDLAMLAALGPVAAARTPATGAAALRAHGS
mmetsp:Transcript_57634/g.185155  ORF Transcript_57634/g.185155 Transcript_57634/m.185155 type:complete len:261 (+) Transcript_57634:318-1100(+)